MFTFLHPIHIGVTEVEYKEKSLQIAHKYFVEDFEDEVEETYNVRLQLGTSKELVDANKYIQKYLTEKFAVTLNGKPIEGKWIGKEVEGEAIWIYVEYEKIKKIKSIVIENRVLFDSFDDQKNLVHFKADGFKKSLLLNAKQENDIIQLP